MGIVEYPEVQLNDGTLVRRHERPYIFFFL